MKKAKGERRKTKCEKTTFEMIGSFFEKFFGVLFLGFGMLVNFVATLLAGFTFFYLILEMDYSGAKLYLILAIAVIFFFNTILWGKPYLEEFYNEEKD